MNPIYLELGLAKCKSVKKAMLITANDDTSGSYLEFGVMTGNSFNFAMLVSKKLEKVIGKMDYEFIGFDSFQGFGEINKNDVHPFYNDETFSVSEKKVLSNIQKKSKNLKIKNIE